MSENSADLSALIQALADFQGTPAEAHALVTVEFCYRARGNHEEVERVERIAECAKRLGGACAMFTEALPPDVPPDQSPPTARAFALPTPIPPWPVEPLSKQHA